MRKQNASVTQWKWKSLSRVWLFATLWPIQSRNSPGQNVRVDSFSLSKESSQPRDQTQVSHIAGRFFISWATVEAQEYWSGWPIPSLANFPNTRIKPESPALQADSFPTELWYSEWVSEWVSEVAQSCPTLCDPWTVAHQAPPSMGFSRQEYWSGLPFPSPWYLYDTVVSHNYSRIQ